jgi:hypothetical protein
VTFSVSRSSPPEPPVETAAINTPSIWILRYSTGLSPAFRTTNVASFRCFPEQLRHAIDEFIKNYNSDAARFEWTKSQVHQVGVTKHISNLRN